MLESDRAAIRQVKDDIEDLCARAEVDASVQPTVAQKMNHYEAVYNAVTRVTSEVSVYRGYEVCDLLYIEYQELLMRYLYKYNNLTATSEQELCRTVTSVWSFYKTLTRWCMHAFGYLSRYYIPNHAKPSLQQTAVLIFWEQFADRHAPVISTVTQQLLLQNYTNLDRYNEQIAIAIDLMSSLTDSGGSSACRDGGKMSSYHAKFDFDRDFILPLLDTKKQMYETFLADWSNTYCSQGDSDTSINNSASDSVVADTDNCCCFHSSNNSNRIIVNSSSRSSNSSSSGRVSSGPYKFLCRVLAALSDEQRLGSLYLCVQDVTRIMRWLEETVIVSPATRALLLDHRDGVMHVLRAPQHDDAVKQYFSLLSRHPQGIASLVAAMQRVVELESAELQRRFSGPETMSRKVGFAFHVVQLQHRYARLTAECLNNDKSIVQAVREVFKGVVFAGALELISAASGEVLQAPVCELLALYAHELLLFLQRTSVSGAATAEMQRDRGRSSKLQDEEESNDHNACNPCIIFSFAAKIAVKEDDDSHVHTDDVNTMKDNDVNSNHSDGDANNNNGEKDSMAAEEEKRAFTCIEPRSENAEFRQLTEALAYVTDTDRYLTMSRGLLAERAARSSYMRCYRSRRCRNYEWTLIQCLRQHFGSNSTLHLESMLNDMESSYHSDALAWLGVTDDAAATPSFAVTMIVGKEGVWPLSSTHNSSEATSSSSSACPSSVPAHSAASSLLAPASLYCNSHRQTQSQHTQHPIRSIALPAMLSGLLDRLRCSYMSRTSDRALSWSYELSSAHIHARFFAASPITTTTTATVIATHSSSNTHPDTDATRDFLLHVNGVQASILFALERAESVGKSLSLGELLAMCRMTWEEQVRVALAHMIISKLLLARRRRRCCTTTTTCVKEEEHNDNTHTNKKGNMDDKSRCINSAVSSASESTCSSLSSASASALPSDATVRHTTAILTPQCHAGPLLQLQLDDEVALNEQFTWDAHEVHLYPPAIEMGAVRTGKDTFEPKMQETRKYACYACIVKIMKAQRAMTHTSLMQECQKQLPICFKMDASAIKLRVEELIRRGFIERDAADSSVYLFRV